MFPARLGWLDGTFNTCLKCSKRWHAQAGHCHPVQGQLTSHGQSSYCWISVCSSKCKQPNIYITTSCWSLCAKKRHISNATSLPNNWRCSLHYAHAHVLDQFSMHIDFDAVKSSKRPPSTAKFFLWLSCKISVISSFTEKHYSGRQAALEVKQQDWLSHVHVLIFVETQSGHCKSVAAIHWWHVYTDDDDQNIKCTPLWQLCLCSRDPLVRAYAQPDNVRLTWPVFVHDSTHLRAGRCQLLLRALTWCIELAAHDTCKLCMSDSFPMRAKSAPG